MLKKAIDLTQCFIHHLEFLNPRDALPSRHYITLTTLSSYNVLVCALVSWVSYTRACKTGNRGNAECVWNRPTTGWCHFTWQPKEYVKSNGWYGATKRGLHLGHTSTLQLAVHEGLLSQCSITDSPDNATQMVGHCCSSICRIRKSHMKV